MTFVSRLFCCITMSQSTAASAVGKTTTNKSVWSDLPRRLATICVGFPLVWTMLSQPFWARIFFAGAHWLSLWEFTFLEPNNRHQKMTSTSSIARLIYCTGSVLLSTWTVGNDRLLHLLLCFVAGLLVWLEQHHWMLGMLVVTLPFRVWIDLAPRDFASTISVLLVVWNCDTGALLVGRISHRLGFPRLSVPKWIHTISPAKSMEGFMGGILGGVWTATCWIPFLVRQASLETSSEFDGLWGTYAARLGLGISLSILAIVGDLMESSIKRHSQSKDSGSILPGHGGVLDRFDSSLLAVLFYCFRLKS